MPKRKKMRKMRSRKNRSANEVVVEYRERERAEDKGSIRAGDRRRRTRRKRRYIKRRMQEE